MSTSRSASGLQVWHEYAGDQLGESADLSKIRQGEAEMAGATCSLAATRLSATMTKPSEGGVPLLSSPSSTLDSDRPKPASKRAW